MRPEELTEIEEDLEEAAYRVRVCLSKMALSQVNDGAIPERYRTEYVRLLANLHKVVARADAVLS
jgi:hypothetical protein